MAPPLTVIMPAYNEEECLEAVAEDIRKWILDKIPDSQLLVVDDGSSDRTAEILDRLASESPRILALHKPNGGHGDALMAGLNQAEGEYFLLLDSDGQIPVEDFEKVWRRRAENTLFSGIRAVRHDPLHRLILTRFVRLGITVLFGRYVKDANVPFKLLHRGVWEKARGLIPKDSLTPSLLLAIFAANDPNVDFQPVEVVHLERMAGVSTLRWLKLAKFCMRSFGQLLEFRGNLRRAAKSR